MTKLQRKIEKWQNGEIFNYTINCCNNIDYLLTLRRGYRSSYELTEREKWQKCTRIDAIIRRQLGRLKTREYLKELER